MAVTPWNSATGSLTDHPDFAEFFRLARQGVWEEFSPRYERAVAADNVGAAERIQARIDELARQRAIVTLRTMVDAEAGRGPGARALARLGISGAAGDRGVQPPTERAPTTVGIDYSRAPGRESPLSVLGRVPREGIAPSAMTPEEIEANSGIIQRLLGMFGATREAATAWERERRETAGAERRPNARETARTAVAGAAGEGRPPGPNDEVFPGVTRAQMEEMLMDFTPDQLEAALRNPPPEPATLGGPPPPPRNFAERAVEGSMGIDYGEPPGLTPGGPTPRPVPRTIVGPLPSESTVFRRDELAPNYLETLGQERDEIIGGMAQDAGNVAPIPGGPVIPGAISRAFSAAGQHVARNAAPYGLVGAAGLTASTSTEANRPDRQAPGSDVRPSITQQVLDAVLGTGNRITGWLDGNAQFAPMDREEFFRSRRSTRQTLDAALQAAEDQVRASEEYRDLVERGRTTQAQRLITQAHDAATRRVTASEGTRAGEEARIGQEYQNHIAEMERRRTEFYNRSWNERGGGVATLINAAAYVVPYLLARRNFNKIADEGTTLIERVRTARASGNAADEARALLSLDRWGNTATGRSAWVALKAAAIPAEIRVGGNIWDALTLPEGTGAQVRARGHLTHSVTSFSGLLEEYGPSILGGLATAAGARLTSGSYPRNEAFGELATLRGTGHRGSSMFDRWLGRPTTGPASAEDIGNIIAGRRAPAPPTPEPRGDLPWTPPRTREMRLEEVPGGRGTGYRNAATGHWATREDLDLWFATRPARGGGL